MLRHFLKESNQARAIAQQFPQALARERLRREAATNAVFNDGKAKYTSEQFIPADGWIRAIIPTVNQPMLAAPSGEPTA
jgi:hypothetical protein